MTGLRFKEATYRRMLRVGRLAGLALRRVQLSWTVARTAFLPVEFSRQKYWSVLPFPPAGCFPNPRITLTSLVSLKVAGGLFIPGATWIKNV